MAQRQELTATTTCEICHKEFANASNRKWHRALVHRESQVRLVREVAPTNQSSLARAVSGLTAELLRGDFTRPVIALVAHITTEEPSLSERDALIMVSTAAAEAKEVTHLQHNLELLRQHPGSSQTAEHRLARKLSYLSMGPSWDGLDRATGSKLFLTL